MDPSRVQKVGPYPVRRLHAEGGQAWIFEIDDPKFGVRRALKALKPSGSPTGSYERFRKEAQSLAALSHPNLVTPFDFGRDEETGWFYYTMAFVDGQTLAERLAGGGTLDLAELRAVFVPVLDALAAVHAAGFVHRDIKPSNILLSIQGNAWLADLGILLDADDQSGERTQAGVALGSALYMSPEQARGRREEIGPASDVFSIGVVLYEALAGKTPYSGTEVSRAHGAELLVYLAKLRGRGGELTLSFPDAVPAPIQRIVRKACRLSPRARFADAAALRVALARALDRAEGRGEAAWLRPLRSRPARAAIAALAAAAALGAGWLAYRSFTASGRAGAALQQAEALGAEVGRLLDEAPVADSQLDIELRMAERGARFELDAARAYHADGIDAAALPRIERALLRFEDVCARLGVSLQARALEAADALEQRAHGIESDLPEALRASRQLPQEWSALAQSLAALRAAPAKDARACDVVRALRDRLAALPSADAAERSIEQQLGPKLAGAARELRESAAAARARATKKPGLHRLAQARFQAGERALSQGDAQQKAGEMVAAVSSYGAARADFDAVPEMQPALAAKAAYEDRERSLREHGTAGLRAAGRVYDFAERLVIEGRYTEAQREYESALALLEEAARGEAEKSGE